MLSIIIPVVDEAAQVEVALRALSQYRTSGAELIVVDGGSRDDTAALARPFADHVLIASRGRAVQMNAGAGAAHGDVLLSIWTTSGSAA